MKNATQRFSTILKRHKNVHYINSQYLNKVKFQYNFICGKEFSENFKNSNYKLYKKSDKTTNEKIKEEFKVDVEKNYILDDNTVGRNNFQNNQADVGTQDKEGLVKVEKTRRNSRNLTGDSQQIDNQLVERKNLKQNKQKKNNNQISDEDKIETFGNPDFTSEYYQNKKKLNQWKNDLKNFNRLKDSRTTKKNKEEDVSEKTNQINNKYKFVNDKKILFTMLTKKYKRKHMTLQDIYKGDSVYIFLGDFKGKSGKVDGINHKKKEIRVKGVNVKEIWPTQDKLAKFMDKKTQNMDMYSPETIKIDKFAQPIDLNHVKLISPFCNKTIRPIIENNKELNDGSVVRKCPETNKILDFPKRQKVLNPYRKFENIDDHEKETSVESIGEITFKGYDYESVFESFLNRQKVFNERKSELILKDKASVNLINFKL